ncbi:MAG TPA: hypothetical protein VEC99_08530, partial [Clostridia bacterium]|nr:hypothetical protein [Clostridia bacterium]
MWKLPVTAGIVCTSTALLLTACDSGTDTTTPRGGVGDTTESTRDAARDTADDVGDATRDATRPNDTTRGTQDAADDAAQSTR